MDFMSSSGHKGWIDYVLSKLVDEPELKEALQPTGGKGDYGPNDYLIKRWQDWLDQHHHNSSSVEKPLQQSELLRDFYLTIAEGNLEEAFRKAPFKPDDLPGSETEEACVNPTERPTYCDSNEPVIIVGAGISGMVAAYELKKVGYNVVIVEMSQRFGGRVKTVGMKDGFDRGLHTEAGAMRLPGLPPKKQTTPVRGPRQLYNLSPASKASADRPDQYDTDKMIHYLTDYYALNKFDLTPVLFKNLDENTFYHFYGKTTRVGDWKDAQFSENWPGWDKRLQERKRTEIMNIGEYFDATVNVVVNMLKKRLSGIPDENILEKAKQWQAWTNDWSRFSLASFLGSNYESVKSRLQYCGEDKSLEKLDDYLPWPKPAITAYAVFSYTLELELSLVAAIQEHMAEWWSPNMHSLKGGLSSLSNAFALGEDGVEKCIIYNRMVDKVVYSWEDHSTKSVTVSGVITSSGEHFSIKGRSVLLTVPLHILRGIKIENLLRDHSDPNIAKPFPTAFQQAIQDVTYSPATKIMLQYRKKFWKKKYNITGGFSKTNNPVGQVHYPTEIEGRIRKKGILLIYTWKADALIWGGLTPDSAIRQAVNQIDDIHPHINTKKYFEVGKVQAWTSDPTALGAFVKLRPQEYVSVLFLMHKSWRNVYFGGEAISFANGWIQGALESGLRAAFQLYSDDHGQR